MDERECCERECLRDCKERCFDECCCDNNNGNIIWILIILYLLFCNNNNGRGGLFGGLF